jgi:hypothetical protein
MSDGHVQYRMCYLFDNLLVFCKRGLTGRIFFKMYVFTADMAASDAPNTGDIATGRTRANHAIFVKLTKEQDKRFGWVGGCWCVFFLPFRVFFIIIIIIVIINANECLRAAFICLQRPTMRSASG